MICLGSVLETSLGQSAVCTRVLQGLLMQTLKRSSGAVLVKEKLLTDCGRQEYSEPSECPVVSVFS